jgi:hypothetical protein
MQQRLEPGARSVCHSLQRVPTHMHLCNCSSITSPTCCTYTCTEQAHLVRKVLLPHRQMRAVYFTAADAESALHTLFKQ